MDYITNYFKVSERGSTVKREVVGGLTTFLAMSYILFVNSEMLSQTGMDSGAVFTATAVAAALGTFLMAVLANYPIALAPGMGMNAFFTYTVVLTMGLSWQIALAAIFCSGILFIILSATGLRTIIINAIPLSLKYAVGTGIGFFIAFIGLQNSGIIVASPATLVTIGDLTSSTTLISLLGLFIALILYVRNFKAAIFIGMAVAAIAGIAFNIIDAPTSIVSAVPSLKPTFGAIFEPLGDLNTYTFEFLTVVLTFLFVDFFDTAGTIIAVGEKAGLLSKEGKLEDGQKALLADSCATVMGSVIGTSSTTSFIESLTGVASGARTGLASVITGLLFLAAMFFTPLLSVVTSAVTAPALIIVGALMVSSFGKIEWEDIAITIPAFITVIMMVLSYSIAVGLASGFIVYTVLMIATNRSKTVHPVVYILSVIFVLYFVVS